ncbi:MAG TPA: hypothetical protein VN898_10015 [Candidatus Binatia bacterium]|nr:hypothetical protein [Candidatus Binatia bacterium]
MSEPSQPVTPLSPEGDSLPMALLAGLVAAAVGAAAWALVTVLTQMQIGWMAVGIGFLVGLAVRKFGKGSAPSFQVLGAVLSLVGCLAGNLLAVCIFAGRSEDVPLMTILAGLTPSLAVRLIVETFSPMDLLFYGLAVYEGYKFARVPDAPSPVVAV